MQHSTGQARNLYPVEFPKGRRAAAFNRGATQLAPRCTKHKTPNTNHLELSAGAKRLTRNPQLATRNSNPQPATRTLYIPLDKAHHSYYKNLHTDLALHLLIALSL